MSDALPPPDSGALEDCGAFCTWWYGTTRRHSNERIVEWAYAQRSECGTYWRTSSPISGFKSRNEAIAAGSAAVTAYTITDEQINALRFTETSVGRQWSNDEVLYWIDLSKQTVPRVRHNAREWLARVFNVRMSREK